MPVLSQRLCSPYLAASASIATVCEKIKMNDLVKTSRTTPVASSSQECASSPTTSSSRETTISVASSEKKKGDRKEKSRQAAKMRRGREAIIFQELLEALPVPDSRKQQLDKASIMRLATDYVQTRLALYGREADAATDAVALSCSTESLPGDFSTYRGSVDGYLILALSGFGDVLHVTENVVGSLGHCMYDMMGQPFSMFLHESDESELHRWLATSKDESKPLFVKIKNILMPKGRLVSLCSATYKVAKLVKKHTICAGTETNSYDETDRDSTHSATDVNGDVGMGEEGVDAGGSCKTPSVHVVSMELLSHPSYIDEPLDSLSFTSQHTCEMEFIDCDSRMELLLTTDSENIVGQSLFDYIHHADMDSVISSMEILMRKSQVTISPFRLVNSFGEEVWVETTATLMDGSPHGEDYVVCIHRISAVHTHETSEATVQHSQQLPAMLTPKQEAGGSGEPCCGLSVQDEEMFIEECKVLDSDFDDLPELITHDTLLQQPGYDDLPELVAQDQQPDYDDLPKLVAPGQKPNFDDLPELVALGQQPNFDDLPELVAPGQQPDFDDLPELVAQDNLLQQPDYDDLPELVAPGQQPDYDDLPELVAPGQQPDYDDLPDLVAQDSLLPQPDFNGFPEPVAPDSLANRLLLENSEDPHFNKAASNQLQDELYTKQQYFEEDIIADLPPLEAPAYDLALRAPFIPMESYSDIQTLPIASCFSFAEEGEFTFPDMEFLDEGLVNNTTEVFEGMGAEVVPPMISPTKALSPIHPLLEMMSPTQPMSHNIMSPAQPMSQDMMSPAQSTSQEMGSPNHSMSNGTVSPNQSMPHGMTSPNSTTSPAHSMSMVSSQMPLTPMSELLTPASQMSNILSEDAFSPASSITAPSDVSFDSAKCDTYSSTPSHNQWSSSTELLLSPSPLEPRGDAERDDFRDGIFDAADDLGGHLSKRTALLQQQKMLASGAPDVYTVPLNKQSLDLEDYMSHMLRNARGPFDREAKNVSSGQQHGTGQQQQRAMHSYVAQNTAERGNLWPNGVCQSNFPERDSSKTELRDSVAVQLSNGDLLPHQYHTQQHLAGLKREHDSTFCGGRDGGSAEDTYARSRAAGRKRARLTDVTSTGAGDGRSTRDGVFPNGDLSGSGFNGNLAVPFGDYLSNASNNDICNLERGVKQSGREQLLSLLLQNDGEISTSSANSTFLAPNIGLSGTDSSPRLSLMGMLPQLTNWDVEVNLTPLQFNSHLLTGEGVTTALEQNRD